ncbi:MAG: PDZ domain-containing protein, partial [Chloroflexota bacterium]|nr:PDZ domain-containing protein [Chloroflexota bacterium]
VLHDVRPSFDPEGRYLYFLSYREFNPVYDGLHFELGFPWGMRPYLVTLQADLANPFTPRPELDDEEEGSDKGEADEDDKDNKGKEEADHDDTGDDDAVDDDEIEDDDGDQGGDEDEDDAGEYDDEVDDDEIDDDEIDEEAIDDDEVDDDPGELIGQRYPSATTTDDLQPTNELTTNELIAPPVEKTAEKNAEAEPAKKKPKNDTPPLQIDLAGIERRVVAFPVPDGRYGQVMGIAHKALFTELRLQGVLDGGEEWDDEDQDDYGLLRAYNFKEYKTESLADNVSWFELSRNRKKLLYATGRRLRVIPAGEKAPGEAGHPRRTGWIDLHRVKVAVNPQGEWEQMFREAWRLQRDHFWSEDMAQVDWQSVYLRYFPLIERVSTRSEFSDLMWEMQGELGTSHAYEYGGDYRQLRPYYGQGFLGAAFAWDAAAGGYRVGEIVLGDSWDRRATSPLGAPGVDVRAGDLLLAINGQRLDETTGPAQLLINQAGHEVLLTLAERVPPATPPVNGQSEATAHKKTKRKKNKRKNDAGQNGQPPAEEEPRAAVVRALHSEAPSRYRAWVEANRQRVHEASNGRVGYVHIPDMNANGYAEFHRGYLAEVDRDGLIIDVRYNAGGHVSQLILEKLARRRIGYDLSRWGGLSPYPADSPAGPLVALTNESAGSDGDIFCHSFKLLKLGPLIGKRTWGGVIGIWPRHALVDGTVTTQPEYSHWFEDVGWNVENYGTDPDIEVDMRPQDYVAGHDPQLARAIEEAQRLLEATPI